jgi:cytochrome c biogenesis protein CcdA
VIPASVTTGGLGISLVILFANLRTWFKSKDRDPRVLAPFGGGIALGSLSTLCAGGVLGLLATWTVHANNKVGGTVVPGSTGQPGSTLTQGSAGRLDEGGGLTVFFLACVMVLAWKATGKGDEGKALRKRMAGGVVCGVTFALTVAVAGVLHDTVVAAANGSGDQVLAFFNHKTHL